MSALDVDGAIQNVKSMLSNLSAWQTITGTSSASHAAEFIHEFGVDEVEGESACPLIILDVGELGLQWRGGQLDGEFIVEARLELAIPDEQQQSYATEGRWFWQQLVTLLDGINSNVQGGGELMLQNIDFALKPGRIDPNDNEGRIEWMTILSLRLWLQ